MDISKTIVVSRKTTVSFLVAIALLLVLLIAAFPVLADDGGRPIKVSMTGAQEAPGPGDPDGSGHATFRLNQGTGEICYTLTVEDIAPATDAHIHIAPAGSPGPVVVPLAAPTTGSSSGCAIVDPGLIKAIRHNPAAYYVNVHNAEFRAGAVRAQLSK